MRRPDWATEPMKEADLPEVLAIEREAFSNPWPIDAFLPDRGAFWARALVLRDRGRPRAVRGYICYWMLEGEMEIQNVAVRDADRSRGGGRWMIERALEEGRERGCRSAWLEVRRSNRKAIALYEQLGFRSAGQRRRYYDDGEDALVMRADLAQPRGARTGRAAGRSLKGRRTGC